MTDQPQPLQQPQQVPIEEVGGEPSQLQQESLKRAEMKYAKHEPGDVKPLQAEFQQPSQPQQQPAGAENWLPQPQTFRSGKQRAQLEQALGAALRQRMNDTPAKAIAPNLRNVLFARSSDSVASVIYKLTSNGILSVPLLQENQQHFDTFIDMLDILSYIVESAGLVENTENLKQLDWDRRVQLFEATPCSELLRTRTGRHPWYTVHRDTSVQQVINFMVTKKTHRMVLTDDKGQFSSIITQHRIIKWLSHRKLEEFGDFGGLTIDDLDLGLKPVICVNNTTRVIDAMMKMYENNLSGVGVLGLSNELIGNISLTDLKDIGEAAQWYSKLFMTCQNFNGIKREGAGLPPLVYSTPKAMLKDVLSKFTNNYIHRVYIVEKGSHKPLGVVTCSDVLNLFAKTPSNLPPQ